MPTKARKSKQPKQASVSDQVRAAIKASGLSGYALGELAGVSRSLVCNFVTGERSLTLDTLDKLAPHLGLRVSFPIRKTS